MIGVEILITDDTRGRGVRLLQGLNETALAHGFNPRITTRYEGSRDWLVLWGPGDPVRFACFQRHIKRGGTAVAWDMGYWASGRGQDVLGMNRLTVNALHPQALLRGAEWGPERLATYPVAVDSRWNADGHIVLAGLGPKTLVQFGLRPGEWECRALARIRAAHPRRRVVFRPKPQNPYARLDVDETDPDSRIETVLDGAALVVCRHSNVAIDAIRYGIPAAVDDGAAAAHFGDALVDVQPLAHGERMQFLQNVAWLQWSIAEAWNGLPWDFLREHVAK